MAKYKVNIKDGELIIKSKLGKSEIINQGDLQIFGTKLIRGLMKPIVEAEKKVRYSAPNGIMLPQYLAAGITVNDYFVIIVQIIETIKKIENYMLSMNNLVTDINYVYINPMTKEVYFIYQPIFESEEQANIFDLFYGVASFVSLKAGENPAPIEDFMNFLSRQQYFSSVETENQIQKLYPIVYKQIHRQAGGKSQVFNGTAAKIYDTANGTGTGGSGYADYSDNDNEGTGLLDEDATSIFEDNEDNYEDSATTLLVEEVFRPYIIRRNTGERAEINKDIFKIGKEKRSVDFFVTNNTNVSRIHAEIITRGRQYYVRDNHSTNRTYVNGTLIPLDAESQINDGDVLKLANDEFEFHLR